MTFDGKAFGAEIVEVVKSYLGKELATVLSRIDGLEKRLDDLPTARDGKDADMGEVRAFVETEVASLKAALEVSTPMPDIPDIAALVDAAMNACLPENMERTIETYVAQAVLRLPAPKDGKDGDDGKSVLVTDVLPLLESRVDTFLACLPTPQNGKSVTLEDVAPMIAQEVQKRVDGLPKPKDGEPGKDGTGVAGALIDRDGNLVVTLSNGETKSLGAVVGKDGEPGADGHDGLGFDDLDVSYDGEKTVTLKFVRGERVKEFAFAMPVVIDRGVYRDGSSYKSGDGVTWAGSFWIAQKDTAAKPDAGDDWRLAVKRGRDGKDGVVRDVKAPQPVRVGTPAEKE